MFKLDALIGFRAFTGNDCVSSFFRKGKETCFKVLQENQKFKSILDLEEFVCKLYGSSAKRVNKVRFYLFNRKYKRKNKSIDMSVLPPCSSTLKLHSTRGNFISTIWKGSAMQHIEEPSSTLHGWYSDGNPIWADDVFPSDVLDIILDKEYNKDDVYGNEVDSDVED